MSNTVAWACTLVIVKLLLKISSSPSFEKLMGEDFATFFVSLGLVCLILDGFRIYKYFST